MTDLIARAQRAETCYNEFIGPAIKDMRAQYAERIAAIAVQELDAGKRADKITKLADAMRILDNIDAAILHLVADGKVESAAQLRVEEIDRMTAPRRKLFEFSPY